MKTINNSVGPDSIILILLVFGAYLRITNNLVRVGDSGNGPPTFLHQKSHFSEGNIY
jgi:hypothetical protein